MPTEKCHQRMRLLFRGNMLLGFVVFAASVFLIITGQYENLPARQAAETLLGRVALGGLLYLILVWNVAVFSRPFLCAPARNPA